ncbi:hypothetical protein D3C87_1807240 [compost metagenome]
MFIDQHFGNRALFTRDAHRHDLLRQNPVLLGYRRTLLAAQREGILIGTADI